MRHDTEELLKGMEFVTAFAFCFKTAEITTDKNGKFTVSLKLLGFPAFAVILLIP